MNNSAPTVLDLFCGAGGFSLGFRKGGFQILQAVDNSHLAVKTYRYNLGEHVNPIDLTEAIDLPNADVIIGGPPCQGFSSAGLRQKNDYRNTMVGKFAEYVARIKPKAFVFENVEGFLTAEAGDRIIELLDPVIEKETMLCFARGASCQPMCGLTWVPTYQRAARPGALRRIPCSISRRAGWMRAAPRSWPSAR
ncbi:DNA cytosine methyltransferase [Candidatus Gracilibacteria bacterium]|nr:DNA cytosine methyltransferase [Candidatus Gracilibacteria bacterium]